MLRKSAICLLFGALLVITLTSSPAPTQEAPGADVAKAERQLPEATSLWKVDTDTGTVYLIGSIHLLKGDDFPLHPKMQAAYDQAQTVVFEIDLDSAKTPEFQQQVFFKALYDSGKTLETELGDSLYGLVGAGLAPLGLDVAQLNQFEPWVVCITFLGVKLQQLGFDPDLGVDVHFYEMAKSDGKNIRVLETPEDQIDLFDSMSGSDQRALIVQTLEQAADIEEMLDTIILHWKTGNLSGLEATINKSLTEYPQIRESLLTRRNRNWITHIEDYVHSRGTYLVVVGVAHMSGEEGLINLLKEAGYEVEQM